MSPSPDRRKAEAGKAFKRFFPRPQERRAVLKLFVHTIRQAHDAGPSSWVATLFDDYARVNVGPVETITASSDEVRMLLLRSANWPAIRPLATFIGNYGEYKTMKDARIAVVKASNALRLAHVLLPALSESVRVAAAARATTTWGQAHSDDLLRFLEGEAGELPRPILGDASSPNARLLQKQINAFITFVAEKAGGSFGSFASNPYLETQEGYKYDVQRAARTELRFPKWNETDIGTGRIIDRVIRAIELPNNNLLPWDARHGEASRPHQPLFEARRNSQDRMRIEQCLFSLYREPPDQDQFNKLIEIFGAKYPLIAYLFFLKDHARFLPIAPETFDRAFGYIGANLTMSRRCSWENYSQFLAVIRQVRVALAATLGEEVTLLDAHSFLWILARQMSDEGRVAGSEPSDSRATERDVLAKARIGQDLFREELLKLWHARCAVTGCRTPELLCASHIKPWKPSDATERINPYNGFLLSPALDKCFDRGYVTFDDDGRIVLSKRLTTRELEALGIHSRMRLRRIDQQHRRFLKYHREHIFF